MTGPEHFRIAERFAMAAADYEGELRNHHVQAGQLAQVHALLALTAATVLAEGVKLGVIPLAEYGQWDETAAVTAGKE